MMATDHAARAQRIRDTFTDLGSRMTPDDRARLADAVADLQLMVAEATALVGQRG